MSKLRVGIIGCGRICEFHAPALRAAGFELAAVCSRPGSDRARAFAEKHAIPRVFESAQELLDACEEWDALLIAVSVEPTLEILERALEADTPILVEKPVAFRSSDLKPLLGRNLPVIVGYNRRFYKTVQEARKEAASGAPSMARMILPESVSVPKRPSDDPGYLKNFFSNSVHGLDMLRFVFGDVRAEHVQRLADSAGVIHGIAATLRSKSGSIIQFAAMWQSPDNFSLTLDRAGRRFELRPFESAALYEGMEVVGPTPETPIRAYRPKLAARVELEEWDRQLKPGFYAQAQALDALARGECPQDAARLEDAYSALALAEDLAGEYSSIRSFAIV
ncbi:MAG: Gfo/Idh/MocA family oxidoreductase [Chloroflexi bacterium]|nr:Gfo/Idh/MocA family oxidoreductase [Chloroflexota bacterium]